MSRVCQQSFVILLMIAANLAQAEVIDGEDFQDPTRPLFVASQSGTDEVMQMIRNVIPASYDLSFIRASSTSPMAVINSERVSIGDMIGGAIVVAINRSSVTLSVNGEERIISLYGESVKSAVAQ